MSGPAGLSSVTSTPSSADDLTLASLRARLLEMVALASTAEKPRPTTVNRGDHPMPGFEWAIAAPMSRTCHDRYWNRDRSGWLVRALDSTEDSDCVYISTPDAMDAEDFMSVPTTPARLLAMSILAACDRADEASAGVTHLDDRRTRHPSKGDQVT